MSQCEMFGFSLIVGSGAVAIWPMFLGVVYCFQWVWAWIDDTTNEDRDNVMVYVIMLILGYGREYDRPWKYYKLDGTDKSDGDIAVYGGMLVAFCLPPIAYLSFTYYPIAIGIALSILLAFVARMARRQSKLLTSHINDNNAHR